MRSTRSTLALYRVSTGKCIKIVYAEVPEQILHLVVALDQEGKRLVSTFMSDGEVLSLGFEIAENVAYEVVVARDFRYVIVLDQWLEGPIVTVRDKEAYNLLVRAFEKLNYRVSEVREESRFKYTILCRE